MFLSLTRIYRICSCTNCFCIFMEGIFFADTFLYFYTLIYEVEREDNDGAIRRHYLAIWAILGNTSSVQVLV